jgi:hypothetical protein
VGALYRRPNSPCYWADYYDGTGKRVRVSTGTVDKQAAKDFLKVREGAVGRGAPIPPRLDRVTYDELRDNLLQYYRTTGKWKHLDEAERRIGRTRRPACRDHHVAGDPSLCRPAAQ